MANVMNSWLEQANSFADYLADEARKLVADVEQAGVRRLRYHRTGTQ